MKRLQTELIEMQEVIIDKEINLKPLSISDTEGLFNLVNTNRNYLKQWLPWLDYNLQITDTRDFIKSAEEQLLANNGFQLGIWYQNNLVGIIGLHKIDWANKSTSIGYWLGQNHQGQGIITKSCQGLIDYCFNELELNRVEIRCAEGNLKSRRIPEGLGLKQEGLLREVEWLYDHYVSHFVYATLNSDWTESRKGK